MDPARPALKIEIRDAAPGLQRMRLFGLMWIAPVEPDDLGAFKRLIDDLHPNAVCAAASNYFDTLIPMGTIGEQDLRLRARELLISMASSGMPHP